MPPQLREIGCHVQNHATQWHEFQHEIQLQEIVVAWIKMTQLFSHIAPVRPKLHRVSQSNETIPNAPKHYETHKNMSFGSNGVD